MNTIIEQIIQAQQFIIANPVRACVNSESSFVKERLQKQGNIEAATLYWQFACMGKRYITDIRVHELEEQLNASRSTMPAWGIAGT